MEEKTCEKCGRLANVRYVPDGVELCGECFKQWVLEEPVESICTIVSNAELTQLADLLGAEEVRD